MRSFFNRPPFFKKQSYRRSFFVLIFLLLSVMFLQKELTKLQFKNGINALFLVNKKSTHPRVSTNKKQHNRQNLTVSLKKQQLFWCSTRVVELNVAGSVFVNKDFKWYLNKVAIDSLFMERWLAEYCKLKILKITNSLKLQNKKPLFCVTFINDRKQCFYKTAALSFSWKSKTFLSSQLQEGFDKILFLTNKR